MGAYKHSPTPWKVSNAHAFQNEFGSFSIDINSENNHGIISVWYSMNPSSVGKIGAEANAKRIVECVNACEGMENPKEEIEALRLMQEEHANITSRSIIAETERDNFKRIINEDIDAMAKLQAERDELYAVLERVAKHHQGGHSEIGAVITETLTKYSK